MSLMRYFIITLFFLSVSFPRAFAQSDFTEGYIVTKNNDTIQGYIEYLSWSDNPKRITFKSTFSGQPNLYTPAEIVSFYVKSSNEYYRGLIAGIDYSPHEISKMQDYQSDADFFKDYQLTPDTVFLQTLIRGKVNLFYYKDTNDKSHFFIEKDSSGIKELEYQQYMVQGKVKYLKGYRVVLKDYLRECASLFPEIERVNYFKGQITKITDKYNNCASSGNIYTKGSRKEKLSFRVNLMAGLSVSRIQPSTQLTSYAQISDADYNLSTKPSFGIALDVFLPSKIKRWALSAQIMYQGWSFYGVNYNPSFSTIDKLEYTLEANFLKTLVMGKYVMANRGKIHPFLNAGASFNYKINSSFKEKSTYDVGEPNTVNLPFFMDSTTIVGGLGGYLGRWQAEIRYESNFGSKNLGVETVRAKQSIVSCLISYRL